MYTRKGGNKMNRITIYRDWKIVRKLDIPDEIKKEIDLLKNHIVGISSNKIVSLEKKIDKLGNKSFRSYIENEKSS